MDASMYENGKGKIKLRAKIEIQDPKTIKITQICYSTTTESLIRSIDEAAKRGKIKIEEINDYTADKVEIEIKMPRGHYAQELLDALYAYTECEITLNSQIIVIKDDLPWEPNVDEILHLHTQKLQEYLKRELEIEFNRLQEKIFDKSLEQIFIENRIYKKIEELSTYDLIHATIAEALTPFHEQLLRIPTQEDRERLLNIPIRRISRFDIQKNQEEIAAFRLDLLRIEKDLRSIKKVAIRFLQRLIKKYGNDHPRRTMIQTIEVIDRKAIETKQIKLAYDSELGFLGTKVSKGEQIECTNFDKILIVYKDGTYTVTSIPEKLYIHHNGKKAIHIGVADKKTVLNIAYRDPKTQYTYAKRFIVDKFMLDKTYRFLDEGMQLDVLTLDPTQPLELQFIPKVKQKTGKAIFSFENVLVKGISAKGIRMATRPVKKILTLPSSLKNDS